MHVCLDVTCHLHFWYNDWNLLHAPAVQAGSKFDEQTVSVSEAWLQLPEQRNTTHLLFSAGLSPPLCMMTTTAQCSSDLAAGHILAKGTTHAFQALSFEPLSAVPACLQRTSGWGAAVTNNFFQVSFHSLISFLLFFFCFPFAGPQLAHSCLGLCSDLQFKFLLLLDLDLAINVKAQKACSSAMKEKNVSYSVVCHCFCVNLAKFHWKSMKEKICFTQCCPATVFVSTGQYSIESTG